MKRFYLFATLVAVALTEAAARVVTTEPAIVQNDSRDIVVTFHADSGNGELSQLTATDRVYAHTGVITDRSESPSDWKHASVWGDNSPKYEMTYAGPATWTLTIPSIDGFYGIADGETVERLAFVFRNASSTLQGKTADGGDIFVDVAPDGNVARLTLSASDGVVTQGESVVMTLDATGKADLTIAIDGVEAASVADDVTLSLARTFDTQADHVITATAVFADGRTVADTATLAVVGESADADYPGGGEPCPGAVVNADGSVTFCLPAPEKQSVVIVGDWDDYAVRASGVMNRCSHGGQRYFWITVNGIADGKDHPYYYIVDNGVKVGDPYARLVLDPYNDRYISREVFPDMPVYPSDKVNNVYLAVFNSDAGDFDWQWDETFERPDEKDLVVYELLIRDFTGREGRADGSGTVAGVISRLDYLQTLGVNAVELLPVMEFDGNNSWGYNTNFYFAPDKAYGTPDDYRRLIDECHRRGMAVILDIVFNQTAGGHPWYQMYPIDRNPMYNGTSPHAYSVLNDWNQDHPLVLRQEKDALRFWLEEYHVDGFRFDLVKGLGSNSSYGNVYDEATNTFGPPSESATNAFNSSRVARMAELHAAMREVAPTAYFINENLAGAQEENEMAADGDLNWANVNEASCQFAMGWQSDSDLNRFYAPLDSRVPWSTVSYAESHDEERMAHKQAQWGASGVKGDTEIMMRRLGSVAAQMLLTPGAHMIWQFQEFGADQTTKGADGGNDTSPKKVVWNYLDDRWHAGLRESYRELIWFRRHNARLFGNTVSADVSLSAWDTGRCVTLTDGDRQVVLLVNPRVDKAVTFNVGPEFAAGAKLMSSSCGTAPAAGTNGDVTLAPGAYALFGTDNLAGVVNAAAETEADACEAVYYNLQGVRIDHPQSGIIVIAVRGRDAMKTIVR